ncbi:MAG: PHP domain-containing protein [Candidatus Omnitrophica bacterium]|nr:PHP domain-containing protein [Candidatus Omnitrophota bacterium]
MDMKFYRFNELNAERIKVDCHIHTSWTDGACGAEAIIQMAVKKGLKQIAFTEHVRRDSDYYPHFYEEIVQLRTKYPAIEIIIGVETKVLNLDGDVDMSDEVKNKAELVLGSVHSIPREDSFVSIVIMEKKDLFCRERDLTFAMIKGQKIQVLAHPAGMSLATHGEFPEEYMESIVREIAKTPMALEWNSKYLLPSIIPLMTRLCKKYNPYVSCGSDVHRVEELGRCFELMKGIL